MSQPPQLDAQYMPIRSLPGCRRPVSRSSRSCRSSPRVAGPGRARRRAAACARASRAVPTCRTCSVTWRTRRANFSPSAALTHSWTNRSGSMPKSSSTRATQRHARHRLVVAGDVVAVADVAAAHHHAVGAPGEGGHDELGVDAPRAHHADDVDVGRVLEARGAGVVGAGVRAPVAEKRDDARLPRLAAAASVSARRRPVRPRTCAPPSGLRAFTGSRHGRPAPSSTSSSARTCRSLKPACWMAALGQVAAHVPHPVHSASLTMASAARLVARDRRRTGTR